MTFETEVRLAANQYLRKAWDAAVDTHLGLRGIRVDIEKGSTASFNAKKALILEISKVAKLTIHEQKPDAAHHRDARRRAVRGRRARRPRSSRRSRPSRPSRPRPVAPKTKQDYVDDVVAGAAKDYGALTGNPADDKKLLDWMVAHYQAVGL